MLRLAIALRHDGSTVELCEEKMQAWYREQDKRLIKSTEEEIFADIKDILKWVYSDRFILKHRRREEIRTEEILFTLRPKTKTARKMLFLITAMCNDYGKCTLTYDRLMKALGCSRQTVAANLKSLEDSGFIRCMKKTPKYEDGKFIRECNSYYVSRETIGTVSEPDEEHRAVSVALRLGRLLDDFDQTYYGLLVQALSEEELRKARFSISERKILAEIVNAREVGSRSAF